MPLSPFICCTPASVLRTAIAASALGGAMVTSPATADTLAPADARLRMVAVSTKSVAPTPAPVPTAAPAPAVTAENDDTDPPGDSLALLVASLAAAVFVIRGRLR